MKIIIFIFLISLSIGLNLKAPIHFKFSNGNRILIYYINDNKKDSRMCISTAISPDQVYYVTFQTWPAWNTSSYNCIFKVNDWSYGNKYLEVNTRDKNGQQLVLVTGDLKNSGWYLARFIPRKYIKYGNGLISQFFIDEGPNNRIWTDKTSSKSATLMAYKKGEASWAWWLSENYLTTNKNSNWMYQDFTTVRIF